jgi:hypothetical protein
MMRGSDQYENEERDLWDRFRYRVSDLFRRFMIVWMGDGWDRR